MASPKNHRIFSVVLGAGLLVMGSFFVLPLMVAAYMLGLMLIGFGAEPRMAEEDRSIMPASPSATRQVAAKPPVMTAAPKKAAPKRKRPARRKK